MDYYSIKTGIICVGVITIAALNHYGVLGDVWSFLTQTDKDTFEKFEIRFKKTGDNYFKNCHNESDLFTNPYISKEFSYFYMFAKVSTMYNIPAFNKQVFDIYSNVVVNQIFSLKDYYYASVEWLNHFPSSKEDVYILCTTVALIVFLKFYEDTKNWDKVNYTIQSKEDIKKEFKKTMKICGIKKTNSKQKNWKKLKQINKKATKQITFNTLKKNQEDILKSYQETVNLSDSIINNVEKIKITNKLDLDNLFKFTTIRHTASQQESNEKIDYLNSKIEEISNQNINYYNTHKNMVDTIDEKINNLNSMSINDNSENKKKIEELQKILTECKKDFKQIEKTLTLVAVRSGIIQHVVNENDILEQLQKVFDTQLNNEILKNKLELVYNETEKMLKKKSYSHHYKGSFLSFDYKPQIKTEKSSYVSDTKYFEESKNDESDQPLDDESERGSSININNNKAWRR